MTFFSAALGLLAALIPPDWSLTKAYQESDGCRRRVSLNNYWRFYPCETNETACPKPADYPAWFLVPGYWRSCGFGNFAHDDAGKAVKEIRGRKVESYPAAFYRRTFTPPDHFRGGEVRLYFELAFTKIRVWLNGQELSVGRPPVRRFHVPLGTQLLFDRPNELVVRCEADMSARYGDRAGLRSNVWLEYRPRNHFGEPTVETSLSRRCIDLTFLDGSLPDGAGQLTRRITDVKTDETVYEDRLPYAARTSIPFVTPKLWSPDAPHLYRLHLTLTDPSGRRLDARSVRFGFREFTVRGADYLLNGKPVEIFCDSSWPTRWSPQWHLQPDYVRKAFRTYKTLNMNALYAQPFVLPESFFDIADEEGFLLLFAVSKPDGNIHAEPFETFLPKFEDYARAQSRTRAYRNHPSNIGILADIWYNYHLGTRNPAYIGLPTDAGDPNLKLEQPARRARAVDRMIHICRRAFPGMTVFTGADGHAGNLYSTHVYHTWGAPPAELSALFSRYGRDRRLPVFIGEMNLQYAGAFSDLRRYEGAPYFAENGARLLGETAYALENVRTEFFCAGPDNDLLRSTWDTDPLDRRAYSFISDIYARTLASYLDQTVFPWRLDGVNGIGFFEYVMTARYLLSTRTFSNRNEVTGDLTRPGNKTEQPWGSHHRPPFETDGPEFNLRPNPAAAVFRRVTAPVTADFVGPGSDRYTRDHAWFGGEALKKNLAVLNRTHTPRTFSAHVSLRDETGALFAEKTFPLEVGAWTNRFAAFTLDTPAVSSRTEATLRAVLTEDGKEPIVVSRAVQLFPPVDRTANAAVPVALIGADAPFAQAVKDLGFRLDDKAKVRIFAPRSMTDPALREQARAAVSNGTPVLVMEQDATASPELVKVRQRHVFINAADHPLLREFKDVDFSSWRSRALTVPDYGTPRTGEQWTDWGGRNMVAGHVFRRPSHGNDLALLVCGFDLCETPLIERRGENGTALFSQLEIGGSLGRDPVATRLFVHFVHYLAARRPPARRTGAIVSADGQAFLARYGVKAEPVDPHHSSDLSRFTALVIVSPDFTALRRRAVALNDFVSNGGRVVYLHHGGTFSPAWLPFSLETTTVSRLRQSHVTGKADASWRHGWGMSELLWRDEPEATVFTRVAKSAEATDPAVVVRRKTGMGEWIFISVLPERLRETSRGKVDRLVSALLTSAGVTVETSPFPYTENFHRRHILTEEAWSFATDERDIGLTERWQEGTGRANWVSGQTTDGGDFVKAGSSWDRFLARPYKGAGWYRLTFTLTEQEASEKNSHLTLRHLVGADQTWVNGRKIGAYAKIGADRGYRIPPGVLKAGPNTLTVRVQDESGQGGLCGPVELIIGSVAVRFWRTPYPEGVRREYDYPRNMIRMY